MAISFPKFRASAPAATVRSAVHEALHQHNALIDEWQAKKNKLGDRDITILRDINRFEAKTATLQSLKDQRDEIIGVSRYLGDGPADTVALDASIATGEADVREDAASMRAAVIARQHLANDLKKCDDVLVPLIQARPRMVFDCLQHDLRSPDEVAGYLEAAERMKTEHRKFYVRAMAADKLAKDHGFFPQVGSEMFFKFNITPPLIDELYPDNLTPQGNQDAKVDIENAMRHEAGALIHALMTS